MLSRAIKKADFIGSVIAMQELFKLACRKESKTAVDTTVVHLTTYRDYVKFYAPVLKKAIANYQIPHRFLFENHDVWNVPYMRYMNVTPLPGNPTIWLPVKPPPDQDRIDNEANIQISQFMMFNGEKHVLDALNVESSIQVGDLLTAKVDTQAKSLSDIINAMPYILQLESQSIAETSIRMSQEAVSGFSHQNISLSQRDLKEIENEMHKKNTSKEGYIVWLKPSQCADPNWLKAVPEVLPHPAKWEAIMDSNKSASSSSSARAAQDSDQVKKVNKKTNEEKELDKAASSLLKLHNGAREMVSTANYMLSLGISEEPGDSTDIIDVTEGFTRRVLTSREVQFYENCKTVDNIINTLKIQVSIFSMVY